MDKSSNNRLFCSLIEELTEDEAFFQVYWARAEHMGAALEKIIAKARENGLTNPLIREADPYDINNLESEVSPGPEADVFYMPGRIFFDAEPAFIYPTGIIPSSINDEEADDADDISKGYKRESYDNGLIELGVNVEKENLQNLYEKLLKLHDCYKTFWYLIQGHWDNQTDEIYENPDMDTPEKIIEYLREHPDQSIHNGYVTLTAYIGEGSTNLNISEHKRIIILTYSEEIADTFEKTLQAEGYSKDQELQSLDKKVHHWHYRPNTSLDKKDLIKLIEKQGFNFWKPERD